MKYTGIANDDRRIHQELNAMGAFNQAQDEKISAFSQALEAVGQFITWMRWKGEVGVYGCRVGADIARKMEHKHLA